MLKKAGERTWGLGVVESLPGRFGQLIGEVDSLKTGRRLMFRGDADTADKDESGADLADGDAGGGGHSKGLVAATRDCLVAVVTMTPLVVMEEVSMLVESVVRREDLHFCCCCCCCWKQRTWGNILWRQKREKCKKGERASERRVFLQKYVGGVCVFGL